MKRIKFWKTNEQINNNDNNNTVKISGLKEGELVRVGALTLWDPIPRVQFSPPLSLNAS